MAVTIKMKGDIDAFSRTLAEFVRKLGLTKAKGGS